MASRTVTVGSSVGLHARPAAIISQKAAQLGSAVTLATVLGIMTLGASSGDSVTVTGDDEGDVNTIADLVASDLDA